MSSDIQMSLIPINNANGYTINISHCTVTLLQPMGAFEHNLELTLLAFTLIYTAGLQRKSLSAQLKNKNCKSYYATASSSTRI